MEVDFKVVVIQGEGILVGELVVLSSECRWYLWIYIMFVVVKYQGEQLLYCGCGVSLEVQIGGGGCVVILYFVEIVYGVVIVFGFVFIEVYIVIVFC